MSLAAASYKHFVYPVMESFGLDGVTMGPSRPRGIDQKVGEAAAGAFAAAAAEDADEAEDVLPDTFEELREMLAETERAIEEQNTIIAARKETLRPVSVAFLALGHAIAAAANPAAAARAAAADDARALADPELLKSEYIQSLVDAGLVDEDAARALHALDMEELTDRQRGVLKQWKGEYQQLRLDIVPAMMHLKVQHRDIVEKMQEVSFPETTPITYGLCPAALRVVPDEASLFNAFLSDVVETFQPLLFNIGVLFLPQIYGLIDAAMPYIQAVNNFYIQFLLAMVTGMLIGILMEVVIFTAMFALLEFPVATVTAYLSVWVCWLLTFVIEDCTQEVAIRDIPGMMPTPFAEPDRSRKISAGDLERFKGMCLIAGVALHNVDNGRLNDNIGHMLQAIFDETKDWVDLEEGSLKFVSDERKADFNHLVLTLNEGLRKCEPTWWVAARECIQKLRGVEEGRESLASFALEHRKTIMRAAIPNTQYHTQDYFMIKHGQEFGFREQDFGEDIFRDVPAYAAPVDSHAAYVEIRHRFYRMLFNPDQFAEGVLAQMQLALNHGTDEYYRTVLTDYILQRHDNVLSRNMRPELSKEAVEAEKLRRAELLVDRDFYDYAPTTDDEGALVRESDGSLVLQPSLNALGAKALLVQEGFLADGNNPVVMDDAADDEE